MAPARLRLRAPPIRGTAPTCIRRRSAESGPSPSWRPRAPQGDGPSRHPLAGVEPALPRLFPRTVLGGGGSKGPGRGQEPKGGSAFLRERARREGARRPVRAATHGLLAAQTQLRARVGAPAAPRSKEQKGAPPPPEAPAAANRRCRCPRCPLIGCAAANRAPGPRAGVVPRGAVRWRRRVGRLHPGRPETRGPRALLRGSRDPHPGDPHPGDPPALRVPLRRKVFAAPLGLCVLVPESWLPPGRTRR